MMKGLQHLCYEKKAEGDGAVQEELTEKGSHQCLSVSEGKVSRGRTRLCSVVLSSRTRGRK